MELKDILIHLIKFIFYLCGIATGSALIEFYDVTSVGVIIISLSILFYYRDRRWN
jgi:hypothetical protein